MHQNPQVPRHKCIKRGQILANGVATVGGELALGQFITTYTFNTHTAKHTFCKVCGITSFYKPRSNPDGIAVSAILPLSTNREVPA
ncbi:hypothetical protein MLD38_040921 [Melastoma candidum]|nr:hypothetical protein MLD38_040921 [Melastoma candidum]